MNGAKSGVLSVFFNVSNECTDWRATLNSRRRVEGRNSPQCLCVCLHVVAAVALRRSPVHAGATVVLAEGRASGCLSLSPAGARWLTGLCGGMWLCHDVIIWLAAALLEPFAVVFNLLRRCLFKNCPVASCDRCFLSFVVVVCQASPAPPAICPPRCWGRTPTASRWTSGPVVSLQPLHHHLMEPTLLCSLSVAANL